MLCRRYLEKKMEDEQGRSQALPGWCYQEVRGLHSWMRLKIRCVVRTSSGRKLGTTGAMVTCLATLLELTNGMQGLTEVKYSNVLMVDLLFSNDYIIVCGVVLPSKLCLVMESTYSLHVWPIQMGSLSMT